MRSSFATTALLLACAVNAASWTFSDASAKVSSKQLEGETRIFTEKQRVPEALSFAPGETLQVALTTKEGSKAKRAHQAFLVIKELASGLEAPFPLNTKDSGKASVKIAFKDLPAQLVGSNEPLKASLIIASFGSTEGFNAPIFDLVIKAEKDAPSVKQVPLRYGKLEEIRHVFKNDPANPPKVVSAFFALIVLIPIPALAIAWFALGANVEHMSKAIGAAPIAHITFFGSIIAMELVFFLYYSSWNLFQTLPAAGAVGVAAFLSGSKALGEVQSRRLAGER